MEQNNTKREKIKETLTNLHLLILVEEGHLDDRPFLVLHHQMTGRLGTELLRQQRSVLGQRRKLSHQRTDRGPCTEKGRFSEYT